MKHLQGTVDKCLYFGKGELRVQGYADANFGGEVDNIESTIYRICIHRWKHNGKLDVPTT